MSYVLFLILILVIFFGYEKSQENSIEMTVLGVEEKNHELPKMLKRFYIVFSLLPFILVISGAITYLAYFGYSQESLIEGLKLLFLLSPMLILATINVVFVLILNKKSFNKGEVVKYLFLSYEGKQIQVPYNKDIAVANTVLVKRGRFLGRTYYSVMDKR